MTAGLPGGPLIAWYGDDFTGSAAVLETLAAAGLPAVLFLTPPDPADLADPGALCGIGIAGMSRTWSPDRMRAELPQVFSTLASTGAPILHYKICSTLDSSPAVGSIGAAIEIGLQTVGGDWCPLFPAAPAVGRHQAFGTLFALLGGARYRLDRHPVMRAHPVTPMDEADVRLHVGRQTDLRIGLIDLLQLGDADAALGGCRDRGEGVVAIDAVDSRDLARVGRLLWNQRGHGLFCAASQGLQEALIAHWRATGLIGAAPPVAPLHAARACLTLSGSMSQVTAVQLQQARAAGFVMIALDAVACLDDPEGAAAGAAQTAIAALRAGRSPLVHIAEGPDSATLARSHDAAARHGLSATQAGAALGRALGRVARQVRSALPVDRVVVAGGDTSGSVCSALGIKSLVHRGATVPGAGLFAARMPGQTGPQFEIALKGGQMGTPDYFVWMRDGSPG